jgi:hypothetical protein
MTKILRNQCELPACFTRRAIASLVKTSLLFLAVFVAGCAATDRGQGQLYRAFVPKTVNAEGQQFYYPVTYATSDAPVILSGFKRKLK